MALFPQPKNIINNNNNNNPLDLSNAKFVFGSDDVLFGHIEKQQRSLQLNSCAPTDATEVNDDNNNNNNNNNNTYNSTCFGKFLDAGTGIHSLRWIASLLHKSERIKQFGQDDVEEINMSITHYTAITADEAMRKNVVEEAKALGIVDRGDIIIGNWKFEDVGKDNNDGGGGDDGEELCKGEMFHTILADYLVGAMDGFSPYYQDMIFPRLAKHLYPGGRIYVVGLNPIPDKVDDDADIFCRVTKLRDACILLAGHRCYREYPIDWIERHLEQAGLKVLNTSKFPILYSHATIVRQLNVARSKLKLFPSKTLAKEMEQTINDLEKESWTKTECSQKKLKLGFDYVITAEKPL